MCSEDAGPLRTVVSYLRWSYRPESAVVTVGSHLSLITALLIYSVYLLKFVSLVNFLFLYHFRTTHCIRNPLLLVARVVIPI